MENKKRSVRPSFVFGMTGAMIAYYIGASTGTGQEFFQSYGTHGVMGILGVILNQISIAALAFAVIFVAKKHKLSEPKDVFIWFLGKYVGTAVYYYTAAFVFFTLLQLISGTGSIVNQFYGLPYIVGSVGLVLLLIMSVLVGFKKMIDIISKIAPFILIAMVLVFVISLIDPADGIAGGSEFILANDEVFRTSDSWLVSTVLHHSYLILFLVPYFVSTYTVDPDASNKETVTWLAAAFIILALLTGLMITSQVANISLVIGAAAPNVSVAMAHTPRLAVALVAMIVAASYTTTAPIALIAADYFAERGTTRYKMIGIAIILLAFGISFLGSYAQIINVLMSVSGRIGLGVYAVAIVYRLYVLVTSKKKSAKAVKVVKKA
ncbi:Uncharacterized membrane protein YkvI [Alkalibacterium putridalgicola]|uniref:Uncharacterized membrane protein YkvI n=1 Tax=Alkalibacterium putridalgicola TaxID=426703 RepID=A0A1H7SP47_9LACT|nr:hypothetical protein [Alkalibacterium putridalgicola]GEK89195.1 hypothetical protein APU01nite_12340 [Alkalibacterium putridalgicola]SEL74283.1 Uncharacterized membrane protein YkvI [Alkalibacterium putridalgicola]